MPKKTTIYDIAKKLNITAATVSRALNNNPKISEKTRALVLSTATKMNYEQNRLALALKSGKSNNVGVIIPRIDHNFFASVIRSIEDELSPHGYHIIICQTHESREKEIQNIDTLLNAQVDGILMSVSSTAKEEKILYNRIIDKNVPLIFFDRKINLKGVSSVTIDDFEGAYKATSHLIEEGCKQIAHFSGDQSIEIYSQRYAGYKQALLENDLEVDDNLVIRTISSIEGGRESMKILLNKETKPDALFSSSDYSALGAIQEIKKQGLKIPEDICVSGFANEPFTRFMELSITSVSQSPLLMGKTAAKVFLEQVNSPSNLRVEKNVVLKPELHKRKSSLKKKS